ncbi:ImmA/IrrE family metallo-endopeptidase [bacterium]|nr:ImmA/IrrE family metallo-endopeptidase [bacterium]
MRRGFKTKCDSICSQIRNALRIDDYAALPEYALANHLGLKIFKPSDLLAFGFRKKHLNVLCNANSRDFSAVAIKAKSCVLITFNEAHSPARIKSSLVHEMAHIICDHDFTQFDADTSLREFPKDEEEEADWLAGCLLIPRNGIIWAGRKGMNLDDLANHYEVSVQMARWRVNKTGVKNQLRYMKIKHNL